MNTASTARALRRRFVMPLGAALAFAGGACVAQPVSGAPAADALAAAHEAYERGHWPQAFAAFAQRADEGHAEAARIALLMHRHGSTLYGQHFEASPYQQLQWRWWLQCGADCAPSRVATAASGC
jgi:hypothetical protein